MECTRPVFVVGSGRCGTRAIAKMLQHADDVAAYHEYANDDVQKLSVLHYTGKISDQAVREVLANVYGSAVSGSDKPIWLDSSHKLCGLIPLLAEIFPQARFLALVRDGRKVVPSFFHKLGDEIYPDAPIAALMNWLDNADEPLPPTEKKYWWNVPAGDQPFANEFRNFSQFQRVCFHWAETNRLVLEGLAAIGPERSKLVRLEDLVGDEQLVRSVLDFIGAKFQPSYWAALQKPDHVLVPMEFYMSEDQGRQFDAICSPMMERLGYAGRGIYSVKY